jgi:SAM-dependent methyltransferase
VSGLPPLVRFVCPQCRGPVRAADQAFVCDRCERDYPVRFGIPDFRLRSDRYLTLDAETAKAARLAEAAPHCTFEELLDFYYRITDDVPPELAVRYKASILNATRHMDALAGDVADAAGSDNSTAVLDAGCGAGGMLIAARRRGVSVVGVDIALRWLVICRKRLQEAGLDVPLVCADMASPPFAAACFDAIVAVDLVEHVPDVTELLLALSEIAKASAPLWVTAANGRTLGPHPSTRLWAIGWLAPAPRRWLVRRLRGIDSLRFSHLLSPGQMKALAQRAGWSVVLVRARRVAAPDARYSFTERLLIRVYRWLSVVPVSAAVLLRVGPSFEMLLRRTRTSQE